MKGLNFVMVITSVGLLVGCGIRSSEQAVDKRSASVASEPIEFSSTDEGEDQVSIPEEKLPVGFEDMSEDEQIAAVKALVDAENGESASFSLKCGPVRGCGFYWFQGKRYLTCWGAFVCRN